MCDSVVIQDGEIKYLSLSGCWGLMQICQQVKPVLGYQDHSGEKNKRSLMKLKEIDVHLLQLKYKF